MQLAHRTLGPESCVQEGTNRPTSRSASSTGSSSAPRPPAGAEGPDSAQSLRRAPASAAARRPGRPAWVSRKERRRGCLRSRAACRSKAAASSSSAAGRRRRSASEARSAAVRASARRLSSSNCCSACRAKASASGERPGRNRRIASACCFSISCCLLSASNLCTSSTRSSATRRRCTAWPPTEAQMARQAAWSSGSRYLGTSVARAISWVHSSVVRTVMPISLARMAAIPSRVCTSRRRLPLAHFSTLPSRAFHSAAAWGRNSWGCVSSCWG
mmetsp:Transcript_7607/g.23129  ORF Transcript_7607/g.23129 Transcript_7607/m.23129 type:complete len:273 (+) Transcript_7607:267-1085(+)